MTGGAPNVCFSRCARNNSVGMLWTVIIRVKCFIIQGTPLFIGKGGTMYMIDVWNFTLG